MDGSMNLQPVTLSGDALAAAWICWEDGEAVAVWSQWQAEQWLRKGDYMHKSISPLALQSEAAQANLIYRLNHLGQAMGEAIAKAEARRIDRGEP